MHMNVRVGSRVSRDPALTGFGTLESVCGCWVSVYVSETHLCPRDAGEISTNRLIPDFNDILIYFTEKYMHCILTILTKSFNLQQSRSFIVQIREQNLETSVIYWGHIANKNESWGLNIKMSESWACAENPYMSRVTHIGSSYVICLL